MHITSISPLPLLAKIPSASLATAARRSQIATTHLLSVTFWTWRWTRGEAKAFFFLLGMPRYTTCPVHFSYSNNAALKTGQGELALLSGLHDTLPVV